MTGRHDERVDMAFEILKCFYGGRQLTGTVYRCKASRRVFSSPACSKLTLCDRDCECTYHKWKDCPKAPREIPITEIERDKHTLLGSEQEHWDVLALEINPTHGPLIRPRWTQTRRETRG